MQLSDDDLARLFVFGMAIQRLDDPDDVPMRGEVMPHPENPAVFWFRMHGVGDTWYPREVEPDGLGGYTFTDPWGARRRISPLPKSEKLWWIDRDTRRGHEENDAAPPAGMPDAPRTLRREEDSTPVEVAYFLVHYARDGYPWGVWQSPDECFYGDDAPPATVRRGAEVVLERDTDLSWREWIDFLAWTPSDDYTR